MLDELEELHPGPRVVAKDAEHGTGDRERVLLLHAAHRHAQVCALAHDGHTHGIDLLADRFRDLVGHALLDLQPPREDVDEPRNLAQADDAALGNICDVTLAEERKEMVLAEAVEVDVLDD